MRLRRILPLLAVFAIFMFVMPGVAFAGVVKEDLKKSVSAASPDEEIRVIIRFKEKPVQSEVDTIKTEGANVKHQYKIINGVSARIRAKDIEKIAKRSSVEMVSPDYEAKAVLDVSAPKIGATNVWNGLNITGKGVNVAVIDTGISNTHPAIKTVIKEQDFTGEGTDDLNGHGTHVAGIIASNDATYKGIAYNANLIDVKVLNQYGSGWSSDVIAGVDWAVANGADIISMSLGAAIKPCDGSDDLSMAVDNAVSKGVVAVVAAGNSGPGNSTINSPGCSKNSITVGAVNDNDAIASFSSRGPTGDGRVKPDVVAPGVGIMSTYKGSFASLSGTSMATPHVSGAAALIMEAESSLSPGQMKEKLKSTSKNLGLDQNAQGTGRIDAYAAVSSLARPANISIINFTPEKNPVYLNSTFALTLKISNTGNTPAAGISAALILPSGLTASDNAKTLDSLAAKTDYSMAWTIKAESAGKFYAQADVTSSNAGQDSETTVISVIAPPVQNDTLNNTPKNNTVKPIKPGLQKKNNTLPPGLAKKAGVTPDSFWYKFKRIYEDTGMFFTFKEERKAEKKLELAEKRLAEAQAMEEKGKPEYKEELVREYKNEIAQANQIVRAAKAAAKEEEKEAKEIERIAERAQVVEQAAKTIESHQAATAEISADETEVREVREAPVREVAQEKAAEKPAVKEQKTNKVQKSEQVSEKAKEEKKSSRSESASANTVSPSSLPVAPSSAASTAISAPAAAASTASASTSSESSSSSSSGSDSGSSGVSSGSSNSASASSSGSSSGSSGSSSSGLSSSSSSGSSSSSSAGSSGSSGSGNAGGNSGSSNSGGNSGGSNAGGNSGGKVNKATGDAVAKVAGNDYARSLFFQLIKVLI